VKLLSHFVRLPPFTRALWFFAAFEALMILARLTLGY
jgi:hypothetical protein